MTKKEQGIQTRERMLNVIVNYMMRNGFPPSIREIGQAAGLKSTSTIVHHLRLMELNGMIERGMDGENRTIRVPGIRYIDERGPQ